MAGFNLDGTAFEPLAVAGRWCHGKIPKDVRFKYLKWNFIVIHYLYLIGWSLVGSVILFGGGLIPYIDGLFFAAGSATQSGLNTRDVNTLELYQQITMYFMACMTNPIFINTFVVFVRLYWFERRFEHIVNDIREQRKSKAKTITRTKSEMKAEDPDLDRLEHGVNGRQIRVLHETTQPNGMTGTTARSQEEEERFMEKLGIDSHMHSVEQTPEASNSSSGGGDDIAPDEAAPPRTGEVDAADHAPASAISDHHLGLPFTLNRAITFADEVQASDGSHELARVPEDVDMSKHVEFLKRQQRNVREGSTLHIPGPRDFDRGEVPREMDHEAHPGLARAETRNTLGPVRSETDREGANTNTTEHMNLDDHPHRAGIKFDTQEHPGHRQETATFETAPTTASRPLERIKSGIENTFRRRRSNSNLVNLQHAKSSIGRTFTSMTTVKSRDYNMNDPMPYLSYQVTTGRNSAFLGLTPEQREELGGIEYRSLKTLAKILLLYFFGFHLSGVIILTPWINMTHWGTTVVRQVAGQNPSWWGVFTSASLFNDLGITLTADSMVSFQRAALPLLYGSFLIIIGNTGFPVMLRFVIWVMSKIVPYGSRTWEELKFLLDHPRRCFTLLFPAKATWWLFWVLVGLNSVDLVFFIILDLNDKTVTSLPVGYRILDGWFQAASTRTAGFACVNLADLHPAIQVSYLIMMYISVFPIAISVRRTNVYEEKSLGVFSGEEVGDDGNDPSYVGQHLRRQLSFDLWYLFLGFFIICIVEGDRLANQSQYSFNMFAVLFEIVSAYGTVGLSLGYPGTNASLSAQFRVLSKLIVVAMMIRGRHRGLPYALDRAILLPSEKLQKNENEDGMLQRRQTRRGSIFAEGHEADRLHAGATWSQTEIDDHGLPSQHTLLRNQTMPAASSANESAIADDQSPERTRTVRRRGSGLSTASGHPRTKQRSMSLSRVIAGGLSAGPTLGKHHD